MKKEPRYIDFNQLDARMTERDDDNGGEPLNAVDRGYHLAVEHMREEVSCDDEYHVKVIDMKDYNTRLLKEFIGFMLDDDSEGYKYGLYRMNGHGSARFMDIEEIVEKKINPFVNR